MADLRAVIRGIEACLPDYVLTNEELTHLVDTSDEWIMSRGGIKERRILKEDGLGTSHLAYQAVNKVLESTGTKPEEVDLLLCHTVTPDMQFPATAHVISDKCGILNAWGFDLSAGCSGFLFGLQTVNHFIASGLYKKVILVCAERLSGITDYTDRTTCPLFGDAAVAMLLEPTTDPNEGVQDAILHVDGVGRKYLYQTAGGSLYPATEETVKARKHFIHQDGQHVFKYAVSNMADVSAEIMERNNLKAEDIAYLIPHQANLRIIDATARRMGLSTDKVLIDIEKYGNTGGTSIAFAIWDFKKRFNKGDKLIFSAFGAGFTWGSIYYRW